MGHMTVTSGYFLSSTIFQWVTLDSDVWILSFLCYLSMGHMTVTSGYFLSSTIFQWVTWQWRLYTFFLLLYFNGSHDSDVWILSSLYYLSMGHMTVTPGYLLSSIICQWVTWQWRHDTFCALSFVNVSHDSDVGILSFLYYLSMGHMTVTSGYFLSSNIFQCVTWQWHLDTFFPLLYFNGSHDSDIWILSFLYYLSMGHMTVTSGYFLSSTMFQWVTLQWRHIYGFFLTSYVNSMSNHQQLNYLLNSLPRLTAKEIYQSFAPLWGEFTRSPWIPCTKGHQYGKLFHAMTSPYEYASKVHAR